MPQVIFGTVLSLAIVAALLVAGYREIQPRFNAAMNHAMVNLYN